MTYGDHSSNVGKRFAPRQCFIRKDWTLHNGIHTYNHAKGCTWSTPGTLLLSEHDRPNSIDLYQSTALCPLWVPLTWLYVKMNTGNTTCTGSVPCSAARRKSSEKCLHFTTIHCDHNAWLDAMYGKVKWGRNDGFCVFLKAVYVVFWIIMDGCHVCINLKLSFRKAQKDNMHIEHPDQSHTDPVKCYKLLV